MIYFVYVTHSLGSFVIFRNVSSWDIEWIENWPSTCKRRKWTLGRRSPNSPVEFEGEGYMGGSPNAVLRLIGIGELRGGVPQTRGWTYKYTCKDICNVLKIFMRFNNVCHIFVQRWAQHSLILSFFSSNNFSNKIKDNKKRKTVDIHNNFYSFFGGSRGSRLPSRDPRTLYLVLDPDPRTPKKINRDPGTPTFSRGKNCKNWKKSGPQLTFSGPLELIKVWTLGPLL